MAIFPLVIKRHRLTRFSKQAYNPYYVRCAPSYYVYYVRCALFIPGLWLARGIPLTPWQGDFVAAAPAASLRSLPSRGAPEGRLGTGVPA